MTDSKRPDPPTMALVDEYLVLAAQGGNRPALGQLARRHHRRFVAHAWRLLGQREAAEDAVQAAWIEILRGLHALNDPRTFRAWAYRIVSRQAAKRIGSSVTERAGLADLAGIHPEASDPAIPPSPALGRALASLPPGQRAALALHYNDGLSLAEVAVALDIPVGTVKTRLHHARQRLKAELEGHDP
jgi:RNA polymerase sigma-70 factor (ECF subfamily)